MAPGRNKWLNWIVPAVFLLLGLFAASLWHDRNLFLLLGLAVLGRAVLLAAPQRAWLSFACVVASFLLGREWSHGGARVADEFHREYYLRRESTWLNTRWLGTPVLKYPSDLWIFQEILYETRPDVVVETGTWDGGGALFLANIFDLLGHGRVITIDITERPNRPRHPRIQYISGSSTDAAVVEQVRSLIGPNERVMVALDSDHRMQHVREELRTYSPLVTPGNYLVVEDTCTNGHPFRPDFGPGPMEALQEFLRTNSSFASDPRREKFMVTANPNGYLKKVQQQRTWLTEGLWYDNHIIMESSISATEAVRRFSDLLNRVRYRGEEFVIERGGEAICRMGPVGPRKLRGEDLARLVRAIPKPDSAYWDDLEEIIRTQPPASASPWER